MAGGHPTRSDGGNSRGSTAARRGSAATRAALVASHMDKKKTANRAANSESDQWDWIQKAFPRVFEGWKLYNACRAFKNAMSDANLWDTFVAYANAHTKFTVLQGEKAHWEIN